MIDARPRAGHSRFPVVREGADEIVGIVHVKHAVARPADRSATTVRVREVMDDPVVVPSTLELDPLLEILREGGLQIAVVVDEFGGIDGVVTLEDLIEEIVGEVLDEHDDRDAGRSPPGRRLVARPGAAAPGRGRGR